MVEQLHYYHLQLLQELCPKCCLWYPLGLAFPSTLLFPYKHMGHAGGTYIHEGIPSMHSSGVTVSDKPSCLPQDASSMTLVYQSDCIILLSQITNFPNVRIQENSLYYHAITTLTSKEHRIRYVRISHIRPIWLPVYCPACMLCGHTTTVTSTLWYIDQHHCTLASRGWDVLDLFMPFNEYNCADCQSTENVTMKISMQTSWQLLQPSSMMLCCWHGSIPWEGINEGS